jgi:hypothetical protein
VAQTGLAYYDRSVGHAAREDGSAAARDLAQAIKLNVSLAKLALDRPSQK